MRAYLTVKTPDNEIDCREVVNVRIYRDSDKIYLMKIGDNLGEPQNVYSSNITNAYCHPEIHVYDDAGDLKEAWSLPDSKITANDNWVSIESRAIKTVKTKLLEVV